MDMPDMKKDEIKAALKKKLGVITPAPVAPQKSLGRTTNPWAGEAARGLFGGGAPSVMVGERNSGDRAYSFQKAIQVAYGVIDRNDAKVEMEASDNLKSIYEAQGVTSRNPKSFMLPLSNSLLPEEAANSPYFKGLRQQIMGSFSNYDPEELAWVVKRLNIDTKAQSYIDPTLGGAMLGGPVVGELIDILRPKTPFARAKWAALPPLGLRMPRVAAIGRSTWASENQLVGATDIRFSPIELKPKKLMQIVDYPNEMVVYGSPSISAWMSYLLAEQLGVELAAGALEGNGGDTQPMGIKTMAALQNSDSTTFDYGINLVTVRNLRTHPQDIMRLPKACERKNGSATEFIGHPDIFWALLEARVAAIAANDQQGPFAYSFARAAREGFPDEVLGRPFNKTTLVAVDANNPTENATYIVGLKMDEFYIGTIGAVEITTSTEGADRFDRDQTGLRAKMYANCTPERTSNVSVALSVPSPVDAS